MIKNYKLVLIGLLVSCSLSNAMDNNKNKNPIDLMFETFISNLLEQGMPPENINTTKKDFYKKVDKTLFSSENPLFRNLIIMRLKTRGINPTKENIAK